MTSSLVSLALVAAEEGHRTKELPMPPWAFAAVTFAVLMLLLGLLWSFRNNGMKYDRTFQGTHHTETKH